MRRRILLLVALAIGIAAGALVATNVLGDDESPRRASTVEQKRDADRAVDEDDAGVQGVSGEPVNAEPLEIVVTDVKDALGKPAEFVSDIGGVKTGSDTSRALLERQLGEYTDPGAPPASPEVCMATWDAIGFEAAFFFGHPPSYERSCAEGPLAAARLTGEQWRVRPGGLAVGDPRSAIEDAFPDARPDELQGVFAHPDVVLLAEGSYGGSAYPTLYATIDDDRISGFVYLSGAD